MLLITYLNGSLTATECVHNGVISSWLTDVPIDCPSSIHDECLQKLADWVINLQSWMLSKSRLINTHEIIWYKNCWGWLSQEQSVWTGNVRLRALILLREDGNWSMSSLNLISSATAQFHSTDEQSIKWAVMAHYLHYIWLVAALCDRPKVAGSIPDEVIEFFSICLILPPALWLWDWLSL
jgi:hypothetical protein